jgi:hypothetical protein
MEGSTWGRIRALYCEGKYVMKLGGFISHYYGNVLTGDSIFKTTQGKYVKCNIVWDACISVTRGGGSPGDSSPTEPTTKCP